MNRARTGAGVQALLTIPAQPERVATPLSDSPMRRIALVLLALAAPLPAAAAGLCVSMDQATRVQMSRPAKDVVVGNPMIADVTVLDDHHILVLGKAYGVTNLMVTDRNGRTIMNEQLAISSPNENRVSVY